MHPRLFLQILSASGRILFRKVVKEKETEIGISDLAPGVYFLRIRGVNNSGIRPWIKIR